MLRLEEGWHRRVVAIHDIGLRGWTIPVDGTVGRRSVDDHHGLGKCRCTVGRRCVHTVTDTHTNTHTHTHTAVLYVGGQSY